MEEQLITSVSYHPVLYDVGCGLYRDRNTKEEAWGKVARDVGLSGKLVCLFIYFSERTVL